MRIALADLELPHIYVIYPGEHRYSIAPVAIALPLIEAFDGGIRFQVKSRRSDRAW
jgi:hypothetical protein